MEPSKVITIEVKYISVSSGNLELGLNVESILSAEYFPFWGDESYFPKLSLMNPGDSMTTFLSADFTSSIRGGVSIKIPKISLVKLGRKVLTGDILQLESKPSFWKVSNTNGAWVELISIQKWFSGKSIKAITKVIEIKDIQNTLNPHILPKVSFIV